MSNGNSAVNVDQFNGTADNAEDILDLVDETYGDTYEDSAEETFEVEDEASEEPSSEDDSVEEEIEEGDAEHDEEDEQPSEEDEDIEEEDSAKGEKEEASEEEGDGEESSPIEIPEALAKDGLEVNDAGEVGKKVKIDGKEEFVSLKDLGNDYSGQKVLSKQFTELDQKKKAYEAEVAQVNNYINEFSGKMKNGDVIGAFQYFGQFAQVPPYMIKEQLIAALKPEIDRRESMTTSELQSEMLEEQNRYLKERNESEAKRSAEEQSVKELQNTINSTREAHNISETEWNEAQSLFQEHLKKGEIKQEDYTVDNVKEYIVSHRAYNRAETLLEPFNVDHDNFDTAQEAVVEVILKNPELSDEEITNLLNQVKEQEQKKEVSEKLSKRVDKNARVKKSQPKVEESRPKKQKLSRILDIDEEWDEL